MIIGIGSLGGLITESLQGIDYNGILGGLLMQKITDFREQGIGEVGLF